MFLADPSFAWSAQVRELHGRRQPQATWLDPPRFAGTRIARPTSNAGDVCYSTLRPLPCQSDRQFHCWSGRVAYPCGSRRPRNCRWRGGCDEQTLRVAAAASDDERPRGAAPEGSEGRCEFGEKRRREPDAPGRGSIARVSLYHGYIDSFDWPGKIASQDPSHPTAVGPRRRRCSREAAGPCFSSARGPPARRWKVSVRRRQDHRGQNE